MVAIYNAHIHECLTPTHLKPCSCARIYSVKNRSSM